MRFRKPKLFKYDFGDIAEELRDKRLNKPRNDTFNVTVDGVDFSFNSSVYFDAA